ncbi:hypothetical protein [Rufibacter immobilis]|uniref:hypothetical protein n=1 Tax=Rufibacter immobilis TaxID=1348778 RepID=UPI0035EABE9F
MKKNLLLNYWQVLLCTLALSGCGQKEEDPSPDAALLNGTWKVAVHEGMLRFPSGKPDLSGQSFYPPYRIEGGDTLFWQFQQEKLLTLKDPYLPAQILRDGMEEPEDSASAALPLDMIERTFQWALKDDFLEFMEVSSRPRYLFGHRYKIEKLTSDSLVLQFHSFPLQPETGVITPDNPESVSSFVRKVRLARAK